MVSPPEIGVLGNLIQLPQTSLARVWADADSFLQLQGGSGPQAERQRSDCNQFIQFQLLMKVKRIHTDCVFDKLHKLESQLLFLAGSTLGQSACDGFHQTDLQFCAVACSQHEKACGKPFR